MEWVAGAGSAAGAAGADSHEAQPRVPPRHRPDPEGAEQLRVRAEQLGHVLKVRRRHLRWAIVRTIS